MKYQHTQTGYLMIISLIAVIFLFGFVLAAAATEISSAAIMIFVIFILTSFLSLTVTIDSKYLKIKFGYGIFQKRFALKEIVSATAVKNNWWNGWGIRIWLWPKTIIYNVSGYDAVEIVTKNGNRFRIGTDEPKKLERAIKKAIK